MAQCSLQLLLLIFLLIFVNILSRFCSKLPHQKYQEKHFYGNPQTILSYLCSFASSPGNPYGILSFKIHSVLFFFFLQVRHTAIVC